MTRSSINAAMAKLIANLISKEIEYLEKQLKVRRPAFNGKYKQNEKFKL